MGAITGREIESSIIHQLAQLFEIPDSELTVESLNAKLSAEFDSMTFIRLVVEIEKQFGVVFKDEEILMEQFGTVALIRRKVEQALA